MDNGWQASANAWIADMGEQGDFGRRYVLEPIMLPRALGRAPKKALDVGCGEGNFCRMLKQHNINVTGVDPTPRLIEAARARDADGAYLEATPERLPFDDERRRSTGKSGELSTCALVLGDGMCQSRMNPLMALPDWQGATNPSNSRSGRRLNF